MRLATAVLLAVLVAAPARAGITIDLDAQTTIGGGGDVSLRLTARSSGDEDATDVEPDVAFLGQTIRGDAQATLAPGTSHDWQLALPRPSSPGFFPVTVRVRYADAKGYPLSALLVHVVRTPGAPAGPVRPTLEGATVAAHGTLRLRLENPQPRTVAGRVRPVVPIEFSTDPETQPAEIPGHGRTDVTLVVQNTGARDGSTYPVYAVFEYDWDGVHQAVVGQATLKVTGVSPGDRFTPLAVGAAALALALLVAWLAWRRSAGRQAAAASRSFRA
jgi:hypothetical protein